MFQRIRQRLHDMRTIQRLCQGAESHARANGERAPGAEHFLLASIDLPDGSARRAFERVGADPGAVRAAIEQQYRDALQQIGIDAPLPPGAPAAAPARGVYRAQPSGDDVMQSLARSRKGQPGPLLGAHVVALVARLPQGVAARTLRAMQLDANALEAAARAEAMASNGAPS